MPQSHRRPPYPFCVIALDVGGTKIAGALVTYEAPDSMPVVTRETSVPTDAARGGSAVLTDMENMARLLVDSAETTVLGIGVDTAGVVDPLSGSIAYANEIMPGWTGQRVAERLSGSLGLPCTNMGDVHAHALGEARWGAARDVHSCLMVGVGTGLGGAYVLEGEVLRGFHGAAGHLGHTLHHRAAGLPCACGSSDHAETVTAGTALVARYQGKSFGDELDASCMGDEIARRAKDGEQRAVEALEFAGEALGEAVGSWCNILDPETVVLSGSVVKAGVIWKDALMRGFGRQALAPLRAIPVVEGALEGRAPLVGAAENLLDSLESE